MKNNLTLSELKFIKESLQYTILKFENYNYPSPEYKTKRVNEAQTVLGKVSSLIEELKNLE